MHCREAVLGGQTKTVRVGTYGVEDIDLSPREQLVIFYMKEGPARATAISNVIDMEVAEEIATHKTQKAYTKAKKKAAKKAAKKEGRTVNLSGKATAGAVVKKRSR